MTRLGPVFFQKCYFHPSGNINVFYSDGFLFNLFIFLTEIFICVVKDENVYKAGMTESLGSVRGAVGILFPNTALQHSPHSTLV